MCSVYEARPPPTSDLTLCFSLCQQFIVSDPALSCLIPYVITACLTICHYAQTHTQTLGPYGSEEAAARAKDCAALAFDPSAAAALNFPATDYTVQEVTHVSVGFGVWSG